MTDIKALVDDLEALLAAEPVFVVGHPIRRAISAIRDLTGWRDIATAPKDGTVIDVWITGAGSRRIPSCRWRKPERANWGDRYGCDKDLPEQWVTSGGFSLDRRNGDATHWLPLPSAPNLKETVE